MTEVEEQIEFLQQAQAQCHQKIRDLMALEDVDNGVVYAQEIHQLQQQKNMLETHKQFRVVRRNRLKYEQGL